MPMPTPKKSKRFWSALGVVFLFWQFGGLRVLLFQDIPMLIFLGIVIPLFLLPISRWIGRPEQRWRNYLRDCLWRLGVLAGAFAVVVFVIPPFSISPQTTYLTEPRSTKLYGIDYPAVIEKQLDPGVPPGENGFRMLVETFGRPLFSALFNTEQYERFCRSLDLPTDIKPKFTFVSWSEHVEALEREMWNCIERERNEHDSPGEYPYDEKMDEIGEFTDMLLGYKTDTAYPWPEDVMPHVRRWLDENDAAVEVFVAATEKSVLYAPPIYDDSLFTITFLYEEGDICRKMAKSLAVRARYRLALGEIEKAWEDVTAMYRLAEKRRACIWSMGYSLHYQSLVSSANRCAEAVMIHSAWTSEEIRKKAAEIAPFQHLFSEDEIRTALRGERLMILDILQNLAAGNLMDEVFPAVDPKSRFARTAIIRHLRPGEVMVSVNRHFDDMERRFLADDPKPYAVRKSCAGCGKKEESFGAIGFIKLVAWHGMVCALPAMFDLMFDLYCEIVEHWRTSLVRHETDISLTGLVFALEAYARENDGNYPDSLEVLDGEIPADPFSGQAFRYVVKAAEDGKPGFLLYSVGPNGSDEDGRGWDDEPRGDDIRRQVPLRRTPDVVK